jgi:hypothetical protein
MVDGILQKFPSDERGKLEALLGAWAKSNDQHRQKFSKWIEKSSDLKGTPLYEKAIAAASELEKAGHGLADVLAGL